MMKSDKSINWGAILFTVVNSIILAIIFNFSPGGKLQANVPSQINMTYADLAAILLTSVCVLVTVLGVGIAIVTFIGYKQIKETAIRKAEAHVKKSIVHVQGDLHKLVKKEVQDITYQHLRGTEIPAEIVNQNSESGD